jgi:hypothetical protein
MTAMATVPGARIVRGDVRQPRAAGSAPRRVLSLAPRAVPRRLIWRLWFGTRVAMFGWLIAAFGMIFVHAALPIAEIWRPAYDRAAMATIGVVEPSGSSEDDRPIYRVHYTFVDMAGVERSGESFTQDGTVTGTRVVDYVTDDPDASCLGGMRGRPFGWFPLVVLTFPVVGLWLALSQLRTGRMATRLLRHGVPTRGRLVEKRETSASIDENLIFELTFEYEVGGIQHRTAVKTLSPAPLEDDAEEPMLYDPQDPSIATPLDHLPGEPRIASDGTLLAIPGIAVHVLVMPIVTAGMVVATALQLLLS